ncbi:MAG: MXAN_2562 family outer membrane beta-barrel protein [Persicimonas sp.]
MRFHKTAAVVVAFLFTFLAAATATAESPIIGISELRLGGYYPSIDEEEGLEGEPFADTFGESNRLLVSFEMGYHVFQGFGSLGVSGRIGYTNFGGEAIIGDGSGDGEDDGEEISESTNFQVWPLSTSLYYRFDVLQKEWNIPLVPVAKGGLDYVMWRAEDPEGETATVNGNNGRGGKFGWHAAGALHLHLDWLEPRASASFDDTWGVNNTYAFAEYMWLEADDFGGQGFDLSDQMWTFGLAFEF